MAQGINSYPFKMVCISKDGWVYKHRVVKKFLGIVYSKKFDLTTGPKYGDMVTVTGSYYQEGEMYYQLMEWPKNGSGYWSKLFAKPEQNFQSISLEKVLEKETPLISAN